MKSTQYPVRGADHVAPRAAARLRGARSVDVVLPHSQWLHDSRDAFAEAFALDLVNGGEVAGITAIEKHQTGVRSCTADTTTPVFRVTVVRLDQRRWQSDQAWCTGQPTLEHAIG